MPLTNNGYEARRFPDLLEDIRQSLETNLGTPISSNPDTVIGILNAVFGNAISIQENNTQALSNSLNLYAAEGVALDKLVAYIGIARLDATPATGNLKVWRNQQGVIDSALLFSDTNGIRFTCPNGIRTQLTECAEFTITPITVNDGTTYYLQINNASFQYMAGPTDDLTSVINYFVNQINTIIPNVTAENISNTLNVIADDNLLNFLNVSRINFTVNQVAAFNYCESVDLGDISALADTIVNKVSINSSIIKVNNPLDFLTGRELETDEELRARFERSVAQGGTATFDAIRAAILQLPNVSDCVIKENNTIHQVGNLPPKSYECVVLDGNPENIANTIWRTKPAGIETYGEIVSAVFDGAGNPQQVLWSRAEPFYIFVRVSYQLYSEEDFPNNGEELIKNAIIEYGDTLTLGKDVIPDRFIGGIYRAVDGVGNVNIDVGYSFNINDTTPLSGWLTTPISISPTQIALFTLAKVEAVLV